MNFVKEQYRLLFEDKEKFLENCCEKIVWIVNGPAELSKCGRFSGRDGVRDFFGKLDASWNFDRPIEMLDIFEVPQHDLVVGITQESGINRVTGKRFVARGTHLWKLSASLRGPYSDRTDGPKVLGFTEFLCVWDGDEDILKVPVLEPLITTDDAKKATMISDPGSLEKSLGSKGNHFGIHGGDTS